MKFREIFSQGRPVLSFEFFPPKEPANLPATKSLIQELGALGPDLVTITYGAGGSTRSFSLDLVQFVMRETKLKVCPHLTCVGHSKQEILELAREYEAAGVEQILALRGDAPAGTEKFEPREDGFSCARDLARFLRAETSLTIAVAGYPEIHKEATSRAADLQYLKEKVDAGAELIITQLFFDEKTYFDFVEDAASFGIDIPIVPGIMPIGNIQQLERFTKLCGASIPPRVMARLERLTNSPEGVLEYGIEEAVRLSQALLRGGAPGIHLYTLNKSVQAKPIVEALGLASPLSAAVADAPVVR